MNRTEVSKRNFQSGLDLLLAVLRWYMSTVGVFHSVLKVRASLAETARTIKSLNRCHLLCPGDVGSECATS